MKARAHITVKGYVREVGFRWFVNDIAESLLLAGWVRNISGGSVEAVFEGEKSEIEKTIEQCYKGPLHAVVSQIDAVWDEAVEDLVGFNIKY
jgi:acylphosphatase